MAGEAFPKMTLKCPRCGEGFVLVYADASDQVDTLEIRSCLSGGIYSVEVVCPKCQ